MSDRFPASPYDAPKGRCPFTGIATFAGTPWWRPETPADAVILGVPYDEGTSYRPGTRLGPRAVRDASLFYAYEDAAERFYDSDRRRSILTGKRLADAGDVSIEPLCTAANRTRTTQAVAAIVASGALPAVIGGDHSITAAVMAGLGGSARHYVHFDSHVDADTIFTSGLTHGSPVARVLEDGLARTATLIGIRGLTNARRDVERLTAQGVTLVTAREARRRPPAEVAAQVPAGDLYVSVDIDVFDPAAAPGTGTPEPGGLFFPEFADLLEAVADRGRIVAFDVCEVNPLLDNRGAVTAHLAARVVIELLAQALAERR